MSYKILTKNGIDNTNIDGARGEYFNTGMRDGIVQGVLSECNFYSHTSNGISMGNGELRIAGHRILIDEPFYEMFANVPSNNIRYSLVAQIVVDDNADVDFSIFVQDASTKLKQDDLYANINGSGTYQIEIGKFTQQTDGTITDVIRTIDVITGGSGTGGNGAINIGNVTTEKIDYTLDAEVDIYTRYDEEQEKEFVDFKFSLPVDVDEKIKEIQNQINAINNMIGDVGAELDEINGEVV